MKKITLIMLIITLSCVGYAAQEGFSKKQEKKDGAFKVYGTDIVTYLNGYEIPCLVINNRVVIYASDMQYYGFDIGTSYSNKDMVVALSFNNKPITKDAKIMYHPTYLPNEYAGDAYKNDYGISINEVTFSDLKVFYTFQEKTLIMIEELADTKLYKRDVLSNKETNEYKEYSGDGFYSEWDAENRVLKIESLKKGDKIKVMGGIFPLESIYKIDYFMRISAKVTGSDDIDEVDFFNESAFVDDSWIINKYYELSPFLESLDITYSFEDNVLVLQKEAGIEKKVYIDHRDYENLSRFSRSFPQVELRCSFNPEYKASVLLVDDSMYIKYSDIEKLTGIRCDYKDGILEATY